MYDSTGTRITSQVTSGRDYSAQEAHPDIITGVPTFDENEPPAVGTRFDVGSTAIVYAGEYYFGYQEPTEDEEHNFRLIDSETHEPMYLSLSDFECFDGIPGYSGIWHDTFNSGYLIRLIDDGEGAFLFRHWGL